MENQDLRRRARYLKKCKDVLWERWSSEYLRGLRDQHNLKHKGSKVALAKGDVIIKGEEKNRGLWKLGIVEELITGREGVVRGAKLRGGRSYLERPVQHLYPMELSCDRTTAMPRATLSAEALVFMPSRDAAVAARARIKDAAELTDDDYWSLNISIRDIATMIRTIKSFITFRDEQGESCREYRRAVLHDITVLKQNRVYFTASILTVQWLAHTLHKIVTFLNLSALVFNPICHQVLCPSDRRVKLLITKSKRNKITPSHNHATLLLHNKCKLKNGNAKNSKMKRSKL